MPSLTNDAFRSVKRHVETLCRSFNEAADSTRFRMSPSLTSTFVSPFFSLGSRHPTWFRV